MKNYEFIKNKNNNNNILYNDFIFNADNRSNHKGSWRCQDRKCRSTGYIDINDEFKSTIHNHCSNVLKIIKLKTLSEIKEKAKITYEPNMRIVTAITSKLEENALQAIPKFKNLLDKCTKIKNKNSIHHYTVFTDIPIHFQKDLRNNKFLQFDKSYSYQNRFTIFFLMKI